MWCIETHMFREVRRRDRSVDEAEALDILQRAEWGVLSTLGEDGWPYGVAVNHVVVDGVVYLHSARRGHKLDNLAHEARVSFCAVTDAQLLPAELSTRFASTVVFGRAAVVQDEEEKRLALTALLDRFAADYPEKGAEALATAAGRTAVIRIVPEHVTGKMRR